MHNAAFADHMERWGQLTGGVAEHASDAAFLQPHQESLIQARKDAWEAKQRQLRHRAAAQQATRDLEAAMARAQDAATRLQCGLLGKYGATNPKLVVFGMHPRRVSKVLARSRALQALAALQGGTPPQHAAEPAFHAEAAPSARGSAPRAEADTPWTGGEAPQVEAEAAALSPTARAGGGEAPRAEEEATAGGGTAPPAVEASQPTMRVIPIWVRVPPEPGGAPQPGLVELQTRGEGVCVASAA